MSDEDSISGDVVRGERFSGGPVRGFLSSLEADERLFEADLAVDRAHVVMLAKQGIIDADVAAEIVAALDAVEANGFGQLPEGEDVHAAIETAVVSMAGEAGRWLHTARSRNDEVATCLRLRLRDDLIEAIGATIELREALADAATDHVDTLLPGYTHLQPAQPTTVAHWLTSYESALRRDTHRVIDTYDRTNRSPLGAAAFAGTPFDVDRELTAQLLGFDGVIEHTMDAVSSRDSLLETAAAMAGLGVTLSGLAEDLVLFSHRGFVEIADDYASTSSIMPQKKNPDTLELVRATAGDAAAAFSGLTTTLKGLPRSYNRDLQAATPHVWRAVDAVTAATAVATGAVATATWDGDACEAAAGEGFATATGVADALAMAGVPFRSAHEVVATAAANGGGRAALEAACESVLDRPLTDLVDSSAVDDALNVRQSVESRDTVGGPAPDAMADQLSAAAEAIETDRGRLTTRRQQLDDAARRLAEEVAAHA